MTRYFVSDATGLDSDTGLTEALAFKTIDKFASIAVAGDDVQIKNDGVYKEIVTLITLGTATAPIIFEGYNTVPDDNGVITINGESTRSTAFSRAAGGNLFITFRNIISKLHTGDGFALDASDRVTFEYCESNNNGGNGVLMDDKGKYISCKFNNNAVNGVSGSASGAGDSGVYISCIANNYYF